MAAVFLQQLSFAALICALALVQGQDIFSSGSVNEGDSVTLTCDIRKAGFTGNLSDIQSLANLAVSFLDKQSNQFVKLVDYHDVPHVMGGYHTLTNNVFGDQYEVVASGVFGDPPIKFHSIGNQHTMKVVITFKSVASVDAGTYKCSSTYFHEESFPYKSHYVSNTQDLVVTGSQLNIL